MLSYEAHCHLDIRSVELKRQRELGKPRNSNSLIIEQPYYILAILQPTVNGFSLIMMVVDITLCICKKC